MYKTTLQFIIKEELIYKGMMLYIVIDFNNNLRGVFKMLFSNYQIKKYININILLRNNKTIKSDSNKDRMKTTDKYKENI